MRVFRGPSELVNSAHIEFTMLLHGQLQKCKRWASQKQSYVFSAGLAQPPFRQCAHRLHDELPRTTTASGAAGRRTRTVAGVPLAWLSLLLDTARNDFAH